MPEAWVFATYRTGSFDNLVELLIMLAQDRRFGAQNGVTGEPVIRRLIAAAQGASSRLKTMRCSSSPWPQKPQWLETQCSCFSTSGASPTLLIIGTRDRTIASAYSVRPRDTERFARYLRPEPRVRLGLAIAQGLMAQHGGEIRADADTQAMIDMLESAPFVERYAIYNWVEDVRRLVWDDGSTTAAGVTYRDNTAPLGYRQPHRYV